MTTYPNRQSTKAYLPRFNACSARTANDISPPKKAEDALLAQAEADRGFAPSGSEQHPDQEGEAL